MPVNHKRSIKKVFVGPGNTAGNAYYIARALRAAGLKARSYTYRAHEFGYPADRQVLQFRSLKRKGPVKLVNNRFVLRPVNAFLRFLFFMSVIFRYDLFYFISPVTFFDGHHDLFWLRLMGKKIAFFFPGCAEKDPHDELNTMKYSDCWYCRDEKKQAFCLCLTPSLKKNRIQTFEKYADYIFSRPNTSGYLKNPERALPMWLMADPPGHEIAVERFNDLSVVRIMHFPSHRDLKGTRYVESAIPELRKDFDLEYLSRRMSNREVLDNLERSHILIDQFTHTFGLLAVEGMSRGCVVICRMEDWARECYPGIPLVSCNPEELETTIRHLLENPGKMKEIAQKSIAWYHQNATPEVVGKRMLEVFGAS
ncbi:MAG: glycosyltransferase family 1 protein [Marinilabilia sp.]